MGLFIGPFIAQHIEEGSSAYEIVRRLLDPKLSGAPYPLLWNVVILSGLIWALFNHRWALVAWFIAPYAMPREGVWLVAIPGALIAGLGWIEMLGSRINKVKSDYLPGRKWRLISSGLGLVVIAYIVANDILVIRDMVVSGNQSGSVPTESWG